jgi:hypothetical protein
MPRIFDNIEQQLLPALQETIQSFNHSDKDKEFPKKLKIKVNKEFIAQVLGRIE